MPQSELLKLVLQVLEKLGIEFMITGSFASSLQGEPRATHDIDLVVSLPAGAVPALVTAFPPDQFYLDAESVHEALRTQRMFNLIDFRGGGKVDFWILTGEPFDQSRFARRRKREFLGADAWYSSPEDTILAKLRWAKLSGGSEKQFRDALRVYEIQSSQLDQSYLEEWAAKLEVDELWNALKSAAQEL